jgi:hypothetical protein
MLAQCPDFLYIGTRKSASTWLYNVLSLHPRVYLPASKGLYYFDDNFANGAEWYQQHFVGAASTLVTGELSHSYLSSPEAPQRIAALSPRVKLLVCLREPVERAFSEYLDVRKNGRFDGTFEAALERFPILLDRGRYATHLERYLNVFDREQFLIQLLDDLKSDGQSYAHDVFRFLGVAPLELPSSALRKRMPASTPRSRAVASAAKRASRMATQLGLQRLRSRAKRSAVVRQALYRPYGDSDRPQLDPKLAAELKSEYAAEVLKLDQLVGQPVAARWGYDGEVLADDGVGDQADAKEGLEGADPTRF